jgi:hypothetical protein
MAIGSRKAMGQYRESTLLVDKKRLLSRPSKLTSPASGSGHVFASQTSQRGITKAMTVSSDSQKKSAHLRPAVSASAITLSVSVRRSVAAAARQ